MRLLESTSWWSVVMNEQVGRWLWGTSRFLGYAIVLKWNGSEGDGWVELCGLVLAIRSSSYVLMELCFSTICGYRVGSEKDRADARGDHPNQPRNNAV